MRVRSDWQVKLHADLSNDIQEKFGSVPQQERETLCFGAALYIQSGMLLQKSRFASELWLVFSSSQAAVCFETCSVRCLAPVMDKTLVCSCSAARLRKLCGMSSCVSKRVRNDASSRA